jgi:hypothetical protein
LYSSEFWTRYWTALILAGLGIFQLVKPSTFQLMTPGVFCNLSMFFRSAVAGLSPAQAARVERVLQARWSAEGISTNPTRYTGLLGIAMAALEFAPGIPFAIPYAIYCLGGALSILATYLYIKRATERRAAPLVRRSPLDALSPIAIAALAGCLVGVAMFGVNSQDHIGAIGVGISMLVLAWIAWRIAGSQAIMLGDDPQVEYAVDERLRVSRANGTVALARAPAVVLVGAQLVGVPGTSDLLGGAAVVITYICFVVAMFTNGMMARRASKRFTSGAAV